MRKFALLFAAICCCAVVNAETYGLNVGGVQVTSDNAADILGDGTVSYDATKNRLTLNNAYISVDYTTNNKGAIVATGALDIVLKGTSNRVTVSNMPDYSAAIMTAGTLTIMGDANASSITPLQIFCSNGCALYALSGDIMVINQVSVDIMGASPSSELGCVKAMSGQFIIDGADVSMTPCRIRANGTTMRFCEIASPSDAMLDADGRIIRKGTTTEYGNNMQVVITSLMRKVIYGVTPRHKGNTAKIDDYIPTESQLFRWLPIGDTYTLTASPAEGYEFVAWYQVDSENQTTLLSEDNPVSYTILPSSNIVYAKFEETEPNPEEAIDQISNDQSPITNKTIKDGVIYIERNGKTYNALGAEINK